MDGDVGADATTDVVVLGAGLAGMFAATAATESRNSVLVVERAPTTGGSAAVSGYVWTAHDVASLRRSALRHQTGGPAAPAFRSSAEKDDSVRRKIISVPRALFALLAAKAYDRSKFATHRNGLGRRSAGGGVGPSPAAKPR